MEKKLEKYIFTRIRPGVEKGSYVVVEGLFDPKRLEPDDVAVEIRTKDGWLDPGTAAVRRMITRPTLALLRFKEAPGEYRVLHVIINTEDIKNGDRLRLVSCKKADASGMSGEELFACPVKKLVKKSQEINCIIETAQRGANGVKIKGWIACNGDARINVKGYDGECRVTRFLRADVKEEYPELADSSNSGYLVEIADVNHGVALSFETGEKRTELKSTVTRIERTGRFIKKSPAYAQALLKSLMERGIRGTVKKIIEKLLRIFKTDRVDYTKWAKAHAATADELKEQRKQEFEYLPRFSIVVPLYETDPAMLAEMINSVKAQSYENWELCLSDGSRNENRLGNIIKKYTAADSRIKYIAKADGPLGIAENTNQAISIATGDYIVLGDHDDTFSPEALFCCVECINENQETDVIYTDEDKLDSKDKLYFEPNFKPDFNIDLLRSNNYICHMFVAKTELAKKVGLFRHEFDGAQDYDFILRCVEQAKRIHHIPKVLYHWRAHSNSTADIPEVKMYAFEAGKKAIEAHYERTGLKAEVFYGDDLGFYKTKYEIKGNPLISIVIPNKDHTDDLKKCMDSIDSKSEYRNYEYIIVENNSDRAETFEFYKEIEKRENVQVVIWDEGFNFSAINNFGAGFAKGEYLLLLNNDTEIINTDCISQLLGYCQREDVGIVGARLYYPDDILQHAGVIIGMGGIAGHAFVGLNEAEGLYQSRSKVACDYSAVTAACMLVKKEIFDRVGGLEEDFKVAFNDIDFCMKVRKTGALVVYNANARLYHYESKSRGLEDTPEKIERFNSEIRMFQRRWPEILEKGDPYYNPNLALDKADFSLKADA